MKLLKIISAVFNEYQIDDLKLHEFFTPRMKVHKRYLEARNVMLFILVKYCGYSTKEAAKIFLTKHPTAVLAVKKVLARLHVDNDFALRLNRIFEAIDDETLCMDADSNTVQYCISNGELRQR